jgi:hypothetical protein
MISDPFKPIPFTASTPRKVPPPSVHWSKDSNERRQAAHKTSSTQLVVKPKRTNELTSKFDTSKVMDQLLGASITLDVRDVLGASRELRQVLNKMMKDQNTAPAETEEGRVHMLSTERDCESDSEDDVILSKIPHPINKQEVGFYALMELTVMWENVPVRAIIDTGSEMNIVNHKVVERVRPSTPKQLDLQINMVGADSSHSILNAHFKDAPLFIGEVETHTDLYVKNKSPFELLLGRPWQVSNHVSINEGDTGTTLVIKCGHGLPTYSIDLSTPNQFRPFKQAFFTKSGTEPETSSKIVELDTSDDSESHGNIEDQHEIHGTSDLHLSTRQEQEKKEYIAIQELFKLQAKVRLKQVQEYLRERYEDNDPTFEFGDIEDQHKREFIIYLLMTKGMLEGYQEFIPEKYLLMFRSKRLSRMKHEWDAIWTEWTNQYADEESPTRIDDTSESEFTSSKDVQSKLEEGDVSQSIHNYEQDNLTVPRAKREFHSENHEFPIDTEESHHLSGKNAQERGNHRAQSNDDEVEPAA